LASLKSKFLGDPREERTKPVREIVPRVGYAPALRGSERVARRLGHATLSR
jgi:hypothetical protein